MRVGANLLWLVPGEVGGSETYAVDLLLALADHPHPGVEPVVMAPPAVFEAHPGLRRFESIEAPSRVGPSRPARVLAESTWLPLAARRAHLDLVHHFGGTIPLVRTGPVVVTVHDLQPLDRPANFSRVKRLYLRARLRPSVRRSRVVTTLSRCVADDVIRRLGADHARMRLVPPAVDADPPVDPLDDAEVRSAHRLDGPWFLYPAITYVHKDHLTLLEAFAQVLRTHPGALLVLTGGAGPEEDAVHEAIERLGIGHATRRPGRVPRAHLDHLYRGAMACTFTSRYEGVGLPLLEAMARGCAVLGTDVHGISEAVCSAGVLLPPGDAEAWADAMRRVLDDPVHRADLVARGHEHVRSWSPSAAAAALVAAWQQALGVQQGQMA